MNPSYSFFVAAFLLALVAAVPQGISSQVSTRPSPKARTQTATQAPHPLYFKRIGVAEGLSASWVQCLAQDRDGFVWMGTENGANRFDGKHFWYYRNVPFDSTSLPSGYANCVVQDSTGALWIGSGKGLSRRDPHTNQWRRVLPDPTSKSSAPTNYIRSMLCARDGTLWIGTQTGLYRAQGFHPSTHRLQCSAIANLKEDISYIFQDRFTPEILWLGMGNGTLYRLNTSTKLAQQCHIQIPHNPPTQEGNSIHSITQDRWGTLWIARDNSGLLSFSPATDEWQQFLHDPANPRSISYNRTSSVALDEENACLWVGTWGSGLNRFDMRSQTFTSWKHDPLDPHSLPNDFVTALFIDRERNLWCGTGVGVAFLTAQEQRRGGFRSQSLAWAAAVAASPQGLNATNNQTSSEADKKTNSKVWVGGGKSIISIDETAQIDSSHTIIVPRGHDNKRAHEIQALTVSTDGAVWAATADGLYKADNNVSGHAIVHEARRPEKRIFRRFDGIPEIRAGAFTRAVWCDAAGMLWICDNTVGLVTYEPATNTYHIHNNGDSSGYSASRPLSFAERTNERGEREVWFGGWDGGLQCYNTATKRFRGYTHDPKNPHSLPSSNLGCVFVRHIAGRNGHNSYTSSEVWCAPTNAGLCRIVHPADTNRHAAVERFTEADGVPAGTIWGIVEHKGKLWCATQRGIFSFCPENRTARLYGLDDGLPSLEFLGCTKLNNGTMFFVGTHGLVTFHPDSLNTSLPTPHTLITGFEALFKPVTLTGEQQHGREAIEIEWRQNVIEFQFAAPVFAAQEQTQYRYKLEGFDAEWRVSSLLEASNEASYSNLNPGAYLFRVQATSPDGQWNEAGEARAQLIVVPPFWRTWWFGTLVVTLVVTGIVVGVRYVTTAQLRQHIQVLEELNRERERISQDVHDDVGSTLTRIALLTETLRYQRHDQFLDQSESLEQLAEQTQSRLEAIASVARDATRNLSEIIWAIKPVNDSLENFLAYTREYALELFENSSTRCFVQMPDALPALHISSELRRNAFLMVKESLNNVVKHSGACTVHLVFTLEVTLEGMNLDILITDDGKGFDAERIQPRINGAGRAGGNGLGNMRRRMERVGGAWTLHSTQGGGTRVAARLPLSDGSPSSSIGVSNRGQT
jgi:signal transduction histidine kinase/ligand-binding sensor domain-containing protein